MYEIGLVLTLLFKCRFCDLNVLINIKDYWGKFMNLTILHLTDLHASSDTQFLKEKAISIADILNNSSCSDEVLILFSGDISNSGKPEEYEIAADFLKIVEKRTIKKLYFAFCPGNHDRNFVDEEMGEDFMSQVNQQSFNSHIVAKKHLNENYYNFISQFSKYTIINDVLDRFTFDFADGSVSIYSLNDCLLSHYKKDEKDKDYNYQKIFVPNSLFQLHRQNEKYSFLLTHIPPFYYEKQFAFYFKTECSRFIDIVFDGHNHSDDYKLKTREKEYLEMMSSAMGLRDFSSFNLFYIRNNNIKAINYVFNTRDCKYYKTKDDVFGEKDSIQMRPKRFSYSELELKKNCISEDFRKEFYDRYKADFLDVFVFPQLREKTYSNLKNKETIGNYNSFEKSCKNKKIIRVFGEQFSGKTSFGVYIFEKMIERGHSPLLVNAITLFKNNFENKESVDRALVNAFETTYENKNQAYEKYNDLSINNKILIIDEYTPEYDYKLTSLKNYFSSIYCIGSGRNGDDLRISNYRDDEIVFYFEPLFKNKRRELFDNYFKYINKKNADIESRMTRSDYLTAFESLVSHLNKNCLNTPGELLEVLSTVFNEIDDLADIIKVGFRKHKILSSLKQTLAMQKIKGLSEEVALRMASSLAFRVYKEQLNKFSLDYLETINNEEEENYGDSFRTVGVFASVLLSANIIESIEGEFRFQSKDKFAFLVGEYAINRFHNKKDEEPIRLIIQNGAYVPLNFNILMNISTNYSYDNIPKYYVENLYEFIHKEDYDLSCVDKIKSYLNEEKEHIYSLTEAKRKQIENRIAKQESSQHKNLLKHLDDYYYVENISETTKNLLNLYRQSKIVGCLLSTSNQLEKEDKRKLAEVAVKLPNIIIVKLLLDVKKDLEVVYVKYLKDADKNKFNVVNDFIKSYISQVKAMVLAIYDNASREIGYSVNSNFLKNEFKKVFAESNEKVLSIQKLMLNSFSSNPKSFAEEVNEYLKKQKDLYYKDFAKRIALRYYFDRYDDIIRDKSPQIRTLTNNLGGFKRLVVEKNKKPN